MAPEMTRDSSDYLLDDSEYDVEDTASDAASSSSEDDDHRTAASLSSSAVSQQWPQSFRFIHSTLFQIVFALIEHIYLISN